MSMTDEQIVKAWGKCIDVTSGCSGDDTTRPYSTDEEEGCAKCFEKLRIDVLALIKRQQADKERLEIELQKAKAEIEDLKADKEAIINGQLTLQKMYLESRAKAVRECIKKIKSHSSVTVATTNGQELYETKAYTIRATKLDEIVKEMTEEKING